MAIDGELTTQTGRSRKAVALTLFRVSSAMERMRP